MASRLKIGAAVGPALRSRMKSFNPSSSWRLTPWIFALAETSRAHHVSRNAETPRFKTVSALHQVLR
jgi:hypothetical protein